MEKVIQLCNTSGPNKSANGFAPLVVWERPITNPYSKCSSDIWGHVAVDSSCGYGCFLTTIDTLFVVIFSLHILYKLKIIILFGITFLQSNFLQSNVYKWWKPGGKLVLNFARAVKFSPVYFWGIFGYVFLLNENLLPSCDLFYSYFR